LNKNIIFFLSVLIFIQQLVFSVEISKSTAEKTALNWINHYSEKKSNKIETSKEIKDKNGENCLYLFNFEDKGFAIVAADDRIMPVLGYSSKNSIDLKNIPLNHAFNEWLEYLTTGISEVKSSNFTDKSISKKWNEIASNNFSSFINQSNKLDDNKDSVEPLIETQWDQSYPYNIYCPTVDGESTHVGCVAVAIAQVMRYHEWPNQGIGEHSYTWGDTTLSVNFSEQTYDYTLMPPSGDNATPEEQNEIAKLLFHVGVSVDMHYSVYGSGSNTIKGKETLPLHFNYFNDIRILRRDTFEPLEAYYSKKLWGLILKTELLSSRPILYQGAGTGGHAFICDGFSENNYFHFNWGWGGDGDGYFNLDFIGSSNFNFDNRQDVLVGVYPNTGIEYSAPNKVTAISGNEEVAINWKQSSNNCSGYNIYKNGEFLTNTTTTFYTDKNVINDSTYSYNVMALYENGSIESPFEDPINATPSEKNYDSFYYNDFEYSNKSLTGWSASYQTWEFGNGNSHSGQNYIMKTRHSANKNNSNSVLILPSVSLTSKSRSDENENIYFEYYYSYYLLSDNGDSLFIEITKDKGITWDILRSISCVTTDMSRFEVDLNEYIGEKINIRFRLVINDTEGLYSNYLKIDDVKIARFSGDNPQNVEVNYNYEESNLNFTWNKPNKHKGVLEGYRVYNDFELIATIDSPDITEFSTTGKNKSIQSYQITSVYSSPISESVPDDTLLVFNGNIEAYSNFKKFIPITFRTTYPLNIPNLEYSILQSSDNLEFREIAVLDTVGYWDYNVTPNTKYFYKILAKNTDYFDCSISEVSMATCSEQGHIYEAPISLEPVIIDGEIGNEEWDDALEIIISDYILVKAKRVEDKLFIYFRNLKNTNSDRLYFNICTGEIYNWLEFNGKFTNYRNENFYFYEKVGLWPDIAQTNVYSNEEIEWIKSKFFFTNNYFESETSIDLNWYYENSAIKNDNIKVLLDDNSGYQWPQIGISDEYYANFNISKDNIAQEITLLKNYPNPFNNSTTISYELYKEGIVEIKIYNQVGQFVKSLISEQQNIGIKKIKWNGDDNRGGTVSTGVYFINVNVNGKAYFIKSVMLK